ncbi:hypothetical protein [Caldimonas tepidiphila]|uniref:hypothetical protein n=1 Tax=Caldimonas tepidiphila TaxID=2315841 RepID=UPI000E5B2DD5|nr:hypothetical protein [Caldimonas tepidiphila]
MKLRHLDALVWALIYGGLFALGLGLFVARRDASLGWALMLAGGGAALIGLGLIFVRARLEQRPGQKKEP